MRKTYRILASTIAVLVVVQAMMIVWSVAGLFYWIDEGATLDKAVIDGWADEPPTFAGAIGHFVHVMSGTFLIPLLGILLLIVSFFAKVPRGVMLAVVVAVSIAVQYFAGFYADAMPYVGLIHGLNAFILFGVSLAAAKAAKEAAATQTSAVPAV